MITSDINSIKKEFPKFKAVDQDTNFLYMVNKGQTSKGTGFKAGIEARINRGSFGDFNVRFIVEKKGCRSKIIGGSNPNNAVKRVKAYLKSDKC